MNKDDDILTALQTLVAHQDKQIADLSDMTAEQWKEIDLLKRKIDALVSRVEDMELSGSGDKTGDAKTVTEIAAAQKPPHY